MVVLSLKNWKEKNQNVLPDRILVYRDGVSEGQYASEIDLELSQIHEACKDV